jgi:hypothetical protein
MESAFLAPRLLQTSRSASRASEIGLGCVFSRRFGSSVLRPGTVHSTRVRGPLGAKSVRNRRFWRMRTCFYKRIENAVDRLKAYA